MHTLQPFGHEGGGDGAGGEAFAPERFVGEGEFIDIGSKGTRIDTRDCSDSASI